MKTSQLLPIHSPDWSFTKKGRGNAPNVKVDRATVAAAFDAAAEKRQREQEEQRKRDELDAEKSKKREAKAAETEAFLVRMRQRQQSFAKDFPDSVARAEKQQQAERAERAANDKKQQHEFKAYLAKRDAEKQIDSKITDAESRLKKLLAGRGIPDDELLDMLRQQILILKKQKSLL